MRRYRNMLILKILKNDFLRKKSRTIIVFAFIMLSSMLVAGGTNLIVELVNSINFLFVKADAPHFVQMHSGGIDQGEIDRFTESLIMIREQQTVEMLTIDSDALFIGDSILPEENSIMDISFVKQNSLFDFLLDMNNQIIDVSPGEIAVPVYFMQQYNLHSGDNVRIKNQTLDKKFIISDFARDAQMNPSIIHSKRFLVHEDDYELLSSHFPEKEYLVEFLLTDPVRLPEFADAYKSSGLPDKGPSVDYVLFKTLNALTDGISAGVIIVLSILLMIIALLCLRFIILAAIEEDYKEIGVMKAIGITSGDIKKIYLLKYTALGAAASLSGYLASLIMNRYLLSNILLFTGRAPKSILQHLLPFTGAVLVSMTVLFSCMIILRRFSRINAVEALRFGDTGELLKNRRFMPLNMNKILDINVFLGIRDVARRFKMFTLLAFVFFFCSCFIIIPLNFMTTIKSPSTISYMGIGKSDIRIDLRQSGDIAERFADLVSYIASDPDVEVYSPHVTSGFTTLQSDGSTETINIETGDFLIFPLNFLEGRAPINENEIALSYLNSRGMGKKTGDTIIILEGGLEKALSVCGIYQDVTNGGRTARAVLPYNPENVIWYTVSLDLKNGVDIDKKISEYSSGPGAQARITDIEGYLDQTLGNTIDQLEKVTIIAIIAGLFVSVLITSLFFKMLIARDASQIAIMKSIGFTLKNIQLQYLAKALLLLLTGITAGAVFANTLGEDFVSLLWSFMGAAQIQFVIDPFLAYLLFPLLLMITVSVTTIISISQIKETSIIRMITE